MVSSKPKIVIRPSVLQAEDPRPAYWAFWTSMDYLQLGYADQMTLAQAIEKACQPAALTTSLQVRKKMNCDRIALAHGLFLLSPEPWRMVSEWKAQQRAEAM